MNYTIATLASHSSLQILKGAKDEGFKTLLFSLKQNIDFYKQYPFIDQITSLEKYTDLLKIESQFMKNKIIMIPHGSFVAYLGKDYDTKTVFPYFGNKKILEIEADRDLQNNWLVDSGLPTPRVFNNINSVDRPVIVKTYGAKGGYGYTLCPDKKKLKEAIAKFSGEKTIIQEYIVGTPVYIQFFYSPTDNKLEILGVDRRYETNVDGIGRIPQAFQKELFTNPSFTVIGNFPVVLRESLLPKIYGFGQSLVKSSQRLAPPRGLYGPFCLETVIDGEMNIYAIEISCRIVAGTNLFINGSFYSDFLYDKPVSTGRRIAMEIKNAIKKNKLNKILN